MARKKKVMTPAELAQEKVKKEMAKEVREYPDVVAKALKEREKEENYKVNKVLDVVDKGDMYGVVVRVKKMVKNRKFYSQDKFYVQK